MRLIPDSANGLREYNHCHDPQDGRFCSTGGDSFAREETPAYGKGGEKAANIGDSFAREETPAYGKGGEKAANIRMILKALEGRTGRQVQIASTSSNQYGHGTVRVDLSPAKLKAAVLAHPELEGWRFIYVPPSYNRSIGQQSRPFASVPASQSARRDKATILAVRKSD